MHWQLVQQWTKHAGRKPIVDLFPLESYRATSSAKDYILVLHNYLQRWLRNKMDEHLVPNLCLRDQDETVVKKVIHLVQSKFVDAKFSVAEVRRQMSVKLRRAKSTETSFKFYFTLILIQLMMIEHAPLHRLGTCLVPSPKARAC
jgi:hypothetical protein